MFSKTITCLLVILLALGLQARETVNFDFGWRFYLGDFGDIADCAVSAFPKNLSKVECLGLNQAQAKDSDSCRDACCMDVNCAIWQYTSDQGCWIGQSSDCDHPSDAWVGGGRDVPAPPFTPSPKGPASMSFDDSKWEVVDAPHDSLINGEYDQNGIRGQGFLTKNTSWYRKHFNLPAEWKGQAIWIYFEGVFRSSWIFVNNHMLNYHDSGYTSFYVRIDTIDNLNFGDGSSNENVIAIRATYSGESGWWYEGSGIYRHTYLVSANQVHILPDSLYGASNVTGKIMAHDPNDLTKGMYSDNVTFYPRAELAEADMITEGERQFSIEYTFYDQTGKQVSNKYQGNRYQNGLHKAKFTLDSTIELWSNLRPYFYTLQADVIDANKNVVDSVNVTIGVRREEWDPSSGFALNGVPFIWRGFNNHNNFAGVGMALPDRVNLFKAQSMRAVGANAWRMSHNPPTPTLLDILDRLGIVVWDENREFGSNNVWVQNQRDMVKRDRNHPSIMAWSYCNEAGCNPANAGVVGLAFRAVSYDEDGFRPVTANIIPRIGLELSTSIDVMGFSHQGGSTFDDFHKNYSNQPIIGSECCSCTTQRGEDVSNSSAFIEGNFNANCNKDQTEAQLDRKYVAGCMVWTLFDYYGEPAFGWPHISSSFGSIDLAGFAKASAYWYRSWWLYSAKKNQTTKGNDVTYNPPMLVNPGAMPSEDNNNSGYLVHIVEHWDPRPNGDTRTIHVYTNAPSAELFVNGASQGVKPLVWQGWAEWDNIKFAAGNLTANALTSSGAIAASHSRLTAGKPAKVSAGIDVPSQATGTGSALVLDGQDTGMIHAAILDSNGNLVNDASHNVTFKIVSGPGRIVGVGNGDPQCHEPNQVSWRSAYHGLSRALIQVTKDQSSSPLHRKRLIQIDRDGGIRTSIVPPGYEEPLDDGIVVEVSVDGLGSSQVTIPVSTDPDKDGVLSVAENWYKH